MDHAVHSPSHVWLFATPWTAALCTLLSRFSVSDSVRPHGLQPTRLLCPWGFSKQEYWSGLPCSPSANLPDPEIKPHLLHLLYWQVGSLPLAPSGKPFMDQSQVNQALICMQGCLSWSLVVSKAGNHWDFPGGPVDKTPYFQWGRLGLDSWSGN